MREVRQSPDGNSIAIRSDAADDAWNAWGVMTAVNGGHWAAADEVKDWIVAQVTAPPAASASPAPETPPQPESEVDSK